MAQQPDNQERREKRPGRLRRAGSRLRERLVIPAAEWLRLGLDAAIWPFEWVAWTTRKRVLWPLQDLLATPIGGRTKVPRAATVGVIGALALGSLAAGAVVASDSGERADEDSPAVVAAVAEADPEEAEQVTPILAKTEPEPVNATLKGVRPSFGAKTEAERKKAKAALRELRAKQAESGAAAGAGEDTKQATGSGEQAQAETDQGESGEDTANAESGSESGESASTNEETVDPTSGATASNATAEEKRRSESALNVAERFAVAFVSYEVGAKGGPVNRVFKDTAQKDLFTSLRKRPPRQPAGGKVPKARVMNVVGGPRKKKAMEVSVGLLRVDGVSELRLEMEKTDRGWVVKTVRG